jgi:hypothetical protein
MFTPFWRILLMAPPALVSVLSAGCLPLGIDHDYPIADVLTALRYQVKASAPVQQAHIAWSRRAQHGPAEGIRIEPAERPRNRCHGRP